MLNLRNLNNASQKNFMSSESLKTEAVHFNYFDNEKRNNEILTHVVVLEKSKIEGMIKAYRLKNDAPFKEIETHDNAHLKQDVSLIFLGTVEYLDKPQKKLILSDDTIVRYEWLITSSSNEEGLSLLKEDFYHALGSLIDAIRVSKKVHVESILQKENLNLKEFSSKKLSESKSMPVSEALSARNSSASLPFGRRHFELEI